MKRLFLAIGIIAATISNLYAFKPKVDYQPDFFEVMEVEVLDTCTRVKMALKHRPNYWVQLDPMEKQYLNPDALKGYGRNLLLMAISYHKEAPAGKRKHICIIKQG